MSEEARKAEANGEDVTFEWKGETFTVPRDYGKWPFTYTLAAEKGQNAVAFQALLGDQFGRFLKTNPTNADFNAFDEAMAKALGFGDSGESEASSA